MLEHIFPLTKSSTDTLCDNSRFVLLSMTPGNAFATVLVTTSNGGISAFSYPTVPLGLPWGCCARFSVPHR
jgi:hypothetical protein